MQASRFEQKYIITEERAIEVRDFIEAFLEADENGVGKPNRSYPVHSIYLDSDDLKLYWGTINGDKERFKLRLRFYDDNRNSPVFVEIKQCSVQGRTKHRAAVHRDVAASLLAGDAGRRAHSDSRALRALALDTFQEFCERMSNLNASPKAHVGYLREAYTLPGDHSVRLTMDRDVRASPELARRLSTTMLNPLRVWGQDVVLELKFTDEFPYCFHELVRTFHLRQCGAAKYVDAVATLGEHRLGVPGRGDADWF